MIWKIIMITTWGLTVAVAAAWWWMWSAGYMIL